MSSRRVSISAALYLLRSWNRVLYAHLCSTLTGTHTRTVKYEMMIFTVSTPVNRCSTVCSSRERLVFSNANTLRYHAFRGDLVCGARANRRAQRADTTRGTTG
uniref:Putative secreted protein n=1 Tax=Anopheles darlingi TaxID=43151 RepID=A0A2M4DBP4_ANODA